MIVDGGRCVEVMLSSIYKKARAASIYHAEQKPSGRRRRHRGRGAEANGATGTSVGEGVMSPHADDRHRVKGRPCVHCQRMRGGVLRKILCCMVGMARRIHITPRHVETKCQGDDGNRYSPSRDVLSVASKYCRERWNRRLYRWPIRHRGNSIAGYRRSNNLTNGSIIYRAVPTSHGGASPLQNRRKIMPSILR